MSPCRHDTARLRIPFFRPCVGAVDVGFDLFDATSFAQVFTKHDQYPSQGSVVDPPLKSPMTGLVRRVPAGQIVPWSSCAEHPQHGLRYGSRWLRGTSALAMPRLRRRNQRFDDLPLVLGQVHIQVRSRSRSHGEFSTFAFAKPIEFRTPTRTSFRDAL